MFEKFITPFDWSSKTMIDFGIFCDAVAKNLSAPSIVVAFFIDLAIIFTLFYLFKREKTIAFVKKCTSSLIKGNRGIITLAISCPVIFISIAMYDYGMQGLYPSISIGGLTMFIAFVFNTGTSSKLFSSTL